jgi:hypothetical protein
MLRIRNSVYPTGYTDRTTERQAPSTKGGTIYTPASHGSNGDMKAFFENNHVGRAYVSPVDMGRIDYMNKHLFNQ